MGENNYLAHEPIDLPLCSINVPLIVSPLEKKSQINIPVSQTIIYDILDRLSENKKIKIENLKNKEILIFTYFYNELYNSLKISFKGNKKINEKIDKLKELKIYSLIKGNLRFIRYKFKTEEKDILKELYGEPLKEKEIKNEKLLSEFRRDFENYINSIPKIKKKEEDKKEILKHLKGLGYI